jgi:CubicO group peptidase (beta-lactamase class C family)
MRIPLFSALISFIFLTSNAYSQYISKERLDSVLSSFSKAEEPGFAVSIVHKGKTVYAKGFGLADVKTDRRNTVHTPFNIASASKQFTAACIYLLEQQGKLKTTDLLSKYFKGLPAYADSITIAHLIYHQSGLRDYDSLLWLRDMKSGSTDTDKDAYRILASQRSLNFKPGEAHSYTNSGYYFLAGIVKLVSGQDLSDFASDHIFNPLGMKNTGFSRSHKVQGKANAYIRGKKEYFKFNPTSPIIGQSNVYSSVDDWDKWFKEMKTHQLLGDKVWKNMTTPGVNKDGTALVYAGGLETWPFHKKPMISHGGDLPGYHSFMSYFTADDLGIIILINNDSYSYENILQSIYDAIYTQHNISSVVKNNLQKTAAETRIISDITKYTGTYSVDAKPERKFELVKDDDALMVIQKWNETRYPIFPLKDSLFCIEGGDLTFGFKDLQYQQFSKMEITQDGKLTLTSRISDTGISQQDFNFAPGRYYSKEINAHYFLKKNGTHLDLLIGSKIFRLVSLDKEGKFYVAGPWLNITLRKNKSHQIDGFTLDHVRIKGLFFAKE